MSALSAVIVALRLKYIRTFRKAGAVTPGRSIRLSEYGLRKSMIFERLLSQGIIVQLDNERYYLDEIRELELKRRKAPLLVIMLIIVFILLILLLNLKR